MTPEVLSRYTTRLTEYWHDWLTSFLESAESDYAYAGLATSNLHDYLQRPGKLIRPALLLSSYAWFSQQEPDDWLYEFALSLELLHVALLIQDDIMDKSDTRRGGKSLHKAYEDYHKNRKLYGDATAFGRDVAILMSDILINEAESLWTRFTLEKKISPKLRPLFDQLKQEVYWGQYADLVLPASSLVPTKEEIVSIMKTKTGQYSIVWPLRIGAKLAHATDTQTKWLQPYGESLGVCYQITDDVLSTFGNSVTTGKSTDSDIKERKYTLLVYYAMHTANPKDKLFLKDFFAYRQNGPRAFQQVKAILASTDAASAALAIAQAEHKQAGDTLNEHDIPANSQWHELADFIMKRNK